MIKTIPIQGDLKVLGNITLDNILIDQNGVYVGGILIGQKGDTGPQGLKGDTGSPGLDSTVAGPKGDQGLPGNNGIDGSQGLKGDTGPQGIQGIQGVAGSDGSGSAVVFNNTSRYTIEGTAGQMVHCVSASTVYNNLTWSRSGTTLTIHHIGHARSVGNRVIIRNTNVDNLVSLITAITIDTYDVTCVDNGSLDGVAGAYSNGFVFAHNTTQPLIASGTLYAPLNADVQLLSLRIHLKANSRAATNYILTLPPSAISVAGGSTNNDNVYLPVQMVRQDSDNLVAVGNTIAMNIAGNYASFQFGALPALTTGILILMQF